MLQPRRRLETKLASPNRNQQRGDPTALAKQDVVGSDRRAGGHGFDNDLALPEFLAQSARHHPGIAAGADEAVWDNRRFLPHQGETFLIELRRRRDG